MNKAAAGLIEALSAGGAVGGGSGAAFAQNLLPAECRVEEVDSPLGEAAARDAVRLALQSAGRVIDSPPGETDKKGGVGSGPRRFF